MKAEDVKIGQAFYSYQYDTTGHRVLTPDNKETEQECIAFINHNSPKAYSWVKLDSEVDV